MRELIVLPLIVLIILVPIGLFTGMATCSKPTFPLEAAACLYTMNYSHANLSAAVLPESFSCLKTGTRKNGMCRLMPRTLCCCNDDNRMAFPLSSFQRCMSTAWNELNITK